MDAQKAYKAIREAEGVCEDAKKFAHQIVEALTEEKEERRKKSLVGAWVEFNYDGLHAVGCVLSGTPGGHITVGLPPYFGRGWRIDEWREYHELAEKWGFTRGWGISPSNYRVILPPRRK
jgi:hypothetical protein